MTPIPADGALAEAWCQPMDCGNHTPRVFLIRFEDTGVGDLTFTDEGEARDMFAKLNQNWNCYLMASLPLIPRPAANGWRPMETAPRDGTWFRARTEHGTERVVHFADEADRYPISHDGEAWSTAPVEWTPVAPRPAEPAQVAQNARIRRRFENWQDALNDSDCSVRDCLMRRALFHAEIEDAYKAGKVIVLIAAAQEDKP